MTADCPAQAESAQAESKVWKVHLGTVVPERGRSVSAADSYASVSRINERFSPADALRTGADAPIQTFDEAPGVKGRAGG